MTAPRFRSTAALSVRQRRVVPHVDRATFVVFALGPHRLAAPVESVERVLRPATSDEVSSTITYADKQVPVLSLETGLHLPPSEAPWATRRALVFQVQEVWVAAMVDAVLEVVTIDASIVRGITNTDDALVGARGRFERRGHDVVILDMLRVVREVYLATQRSESPRSAGTP